MKDMNKFQLIVLGVFMLLIVVGVGSVAFFRGGGRSVNEARAVVWGTLDQRAMDALIEEVRGSRNDFDVTYREVREDSFDRELVEALASGRGPDVILLTQDLIIRHFDKVFPLPYETYGEREFRDAFIEEGELFLGTAGVLGIPMSIDPMVMYWNRDIFTDAGISEPPRYWDEFYELTERITDRDNFGNIFRSTTALGEFRNVINAKEILSTLIIQAGNPIVTKVGSTLYATLPETYGMVTPPADSAVRFFTEFSNPVKEAYTWNRSLPRSQDHFLAGDLAIYFGYASEAETLHAKNANLNFDVALMPQARDVGTRMTFGRMHALSVLRSSRDTTAAFYAAYELTSAASQKAWVKHSGMPPVRRDMLTVRPTDRVQVISYDSALISRAYLDPDPDKTDTIFTSMVEDVTSGRSDIRGAIFQANGEIVKLFPK